MNKPAVKICGIKTPAMALTCAELGAKYIGLVFCEKSIRFIDVKDAIAIVKAARQTGAIPVGVFTNHDAQVIKNICDATQIDHVQLHGDLSRQSIVNLPDPLHTIYVISSDKIINQDHVDSLDPSKDFLLYDGPRGGSGETVNWTSINPPNHLRFFLAGGLHANNIDSAIQIVRPFGVDISSGVESAPGKKDPILITEFIKAVSHA